MLTYRGGDHYDPNKRSYVPYTASDSLAYKTGFNQGGANSGSNNGVTIENGDSNTAALNAGRWDKAVRALGPDDHYDNYFSYNDAIYRKDADDTWHKGINAQGSKVPTSFVPLTKGDLAARAAELLKNAQYLKSIPKGSSFYL